MKQQKGRPQRVAELIRKEIGALLTKGLKDPRIGFVSIMSVRMSPDLHYANVYVSLYGEERERKSSLIGLRNSSGWIRREVGKHLRLRVTPEIRFFPDETLDEVYNLESVFQEIHEEQQQAPMIQIDMEGVVAELRQAESILITTHEHPDGDAVGSVLALAGLAKGLGKDPVYCAISDPVPKIYEDLPGALSILGPDSARPDFDLAVIVDVASFERVGAIAQWFPEGGRVLVVDHHREDAPEGTAGFIDHEYAAVGEIVAELFEVAGIPMPPDAAHCAYVAQITDTGGYRFSNTNARSHRIAARLLDTGIDGAAICGAVFEVMSSATFELTRRVLDRMDLRSDGRLATTYVTAQDLEDVAGKKEDMNGLVNYARNIEGVQVGVLFNGVEAAVTKVSMRSHRSFDAAVFLRGYGGGGHAAAAGATIETPLDEVRAEMTARLEALLDTDEAEAT